MLTSSSESETVIIQLANLMSQNGFIFALFAGLCQLAGINEPIRITTYTGNQRKDDIKEKWELVGTHTGRRTFIVNCLSLGIPPNVVMKWTGHSDYKAMKPYIDIVDSIKASEMTKLDSIL